jgi:hypothetical protein
LSLEDLDIQGFIRLAALDGVAVDGDDIVVFPGQNLGQMRPHLTEAEENDVEIHDSGSMARPEAGFNL